MRLVVPPTKFAPTGKKAGNCDACRLFATLEALKWHDGKAYWLCGNCYGFASKSAKKIVKLQIGWNEFKKQCLEFRHAKKEGLIIKPKFTR